MIEVSVLEIKNHEMKHKQQNQVNKREGTREQRVHTRLEAAAKGRYVERPKSPTSVNGRRW